MILSTISGNSHHDIPFPLVHHKLALAVGSSVLIRRSDPPRWAVTDPEVKHLSRLHEIVETVHYLLQLINIPNVDVNCQRGVPFPIGGRVFARFRIHELTSMDVV